MSIRLFQKSISLIYFLLLKPFFNVSLQPTHPVLFAYVTSATKNKRPSHLMRLLATIVAAKSYAHFASLLDDSWNTHDVFEHYSHNSNDFQ